MVLTHTKVCINTRTILISDAYAMGADTPTRGGFWTRWLDVAVLGLELVLSAANFVDEGFDFLAQAVAFVG